MLKMNDTALIIVDVQGKLATLMHESDELFDNLVKITRGAWVLGLPILWNEQLPDKLGPTISQIKEILKGMEPMAKKSFSCCGNDDFKNKLKASNCHQVLLTGIETHVCVYQTALDLINDGFEVYLVGDAVSSRKLENKRIGIQAMKDAGAKITSVEMALFEMLEVAEGDKFKQIIKIVK
ncbi:MAG: hydrolase [candidate division Zixibacteria bacterium]|nr:hydrolase [candidate division Zixibacteria bacterium]